MLIIIKMVSGEKHRFRNSDYDNVQDWFEANFSLPNATWWSPNKKSDLLLNINNIESIHED